MRTGERVLAQEREQIDLALDLAFGLDLVDAQEVAAPGGFYQIVAVDRAVGDAGGIQYAAEIVVVTELR
jgi:hypothetical protein